MKKEKEFYLTPNLSVVHLSAVSFVCASQFGGIAATEEEADSTEWSSIN